MPLGTANIAQCVPVLLIDSVVRAHSIQIGLVQGGLMFTYTAEFHGIIHHSTVKKILILKGLVRFFSALPLRKRRNSFQCMCFKSIVAYI